MKANKNKIFTWSILVVLVAAFFVSLPILKFPSVGADGESWLDGWRYRKSHVIHNATGAGTNYQVPITVHLGYGSDDGDDVYLDGRGLADLGDVNFTASDGITPLDYYVEDGTQSSFQFTEADDNPLFTLGYFCQPFYDEGTFYMYYWVFDENDDYEIGVATSADGRTGWSDLGIILTHGANGAYDEHGCFNSKVWKEGSTYYMIYTAWQDDLNVTAALATSSSPTSGWVKSESNPVMEGDAGEWDYTGVETWDVIKVSGTYYLYYNTMHAAPRKVGLATSTNLIDWTKDPNNPILNSSATLLYYGRYIATVCSIGDRYYLAVTNRDNTQGDNVGFTEIWEDDAPTFYSEDRVYIGKVFTAASVPWADYENDGAIFFKTSITPNSLYSDENGFWLWNGGREDSVTASWDVGLFYGDAYAKTYWVEVSDDLSSSDATIYIYYGNSEASTSSSIFATGLSLSDDFDDNSLSGTWTTFSQSGDTVEEAGQALHSRCPHADWHHVYVASADALDTGDNIRFIQLVNVTNVAGQQSIEIFYGDQDLASVLWGVLYDEGAQPSRFTLKTTVSSSWALRWTSSSTYPPNAKYLLDIVSNSTHVCVSIYDVGRTLLETSGFYAVDEGSGYLSLNGLGYGNVATPPNVYTYWNFHAKYVNPEPQNGDWGSMESVIYPDYANVGNTAVNNGYSVTCYSYWTVTADALSGFIFQSNATGSTTNSTWTAFSPTNASWANSTINLDRALGDKVAYRWYANASGGKWTATSENTFTVSATLSFYNNANGKLKRNGAVVANGTQTTYSSPTNLTLYGAPTDPSYALDYFSWYAGTETSEDNPLTFTVDWSTSFWAVFATANLSEPDEPSEPTIGDGDVTVDLYFHADAQQVNNVTGWAALTTVPTQEADVDVDAAGDNTVTWGWRVYLQYEGFASELTGGTPVAQVVLNYTQETYVAQNATFDFSDVTLYFGHTALKFVLYNRWNASSTWTARAVFITENLFYPYMKASTATFTVWLGRWESGGSTYANVTWGASPHLSGVFGLSFTSARAPDWQAYYLGQGNFVSFLVIPYTLIIGNGIYALGLFGVAMSLYIRYRQFTILILFVVLMGGSGAAGVINLLVGDLFMGVVWIAAVFGLALVFWRVFR